MWEAAAYAGVVKAFDWHAHLYEQRPSTSRSGRTLNAVCRPSGPWTPERELLAAVLAEAIQCASGHPTNTGCGECREGWTERRHVRLQREAVEWIAGAPVVGGYTFADVCGHLGLDVDATRAAILGQVAA